MHQATNLAQAQNKPSQTKDVSMGYHSHDTQLHPQTSQMPTHLT